MKNEENHQKHKKWTGTKNVKNIRTIIIQYWTRNKSLNESQETTPKTPKSKKFEGYTALNLQAVRDAKMHFLSYSFMSRCHNDKQFGLTANIEECSYHLDFNFLEVLAIRFHSRWWFHLWMLILIQWSPTIIFFTQLRLWR